MQRHFVHCAIVLSLLASTLLTPTGSASAQEGKEVHPRSVVRPEASSLSTAQFMDDFLTRMSRFRILINPGTPGQATDYYKRIGSKLAVTFVDDVPPNLTPPRATNLDELLAYLGYQNGVDQGLSAADLEQLNSFLLMPRNDAEFQALDAATSGRIGRRLILADFWDGSSSKSKILVSRFFAPKIATYYDSKDAFKPINRDAIIPGWRKLVRIPARAGSPAAAHLKHAYILFNVKEADPDKNPFRADNESKNNQVILVPLTFDRTSEDACFFAVYQARSEGYKLGLFLGADFDLPGHTAVQSGGGSLDSHYYVPTACAACHGHGPKGAPTGDVFNYAKPNYLDTDQWYDWLGFDFRNTQGSLHDVVFDGGKDHGSGDFQRAFNVVAALNQTIKEETFQAEPTGAESFQTLAPKKWLTLHAVDTNTLEAGDRNHKPYSMRSIAAAPADQWDPNNPDEMRLLKLLDNHCFRCHSSVVYNVFDKKAVKVRAKLIRQFLNLQVNDPEGHALPGFTMPQGRVLEENDRADILRLVQKLFIAPPTVAFTSKVAANIALVASNYEYTDSTGHVNPTIQVTRGTTVTMSLTSSDGTHDWKLVDGSTGDELAETTTVSGNVPVTVTFTADREGSHVYFCSVDGHRELGMEGRFIVVP